LEQVLLLQRPLKRLVKRLLWSQDEIQQKPRDEEQYDEKRREYLRKDAPAPGLDIAKCPGDERKPDGDEIRNPDRKQKLGASRGGFDHENFPLGELVSISITAGLSVPDTLKSSDRKHENTGTACALFGRPRDPEFRLPGERTQWFDPAYTPAGSSSDKS